MGGGWHAAWQRRLEGRRCREFAPFHRAPTVNASVTGRPTLQRFSLPEPCMIGYVTLGTNDPPRGDGFYAGYFRDLDGNKLNAFFMG